jgi:hydroxymethylpyrimidine/phosphomethylpyrimidine kinase
VNIDDLISIAKSVQELGPKYVLVKGGHLPLKKDGDVAGLEEERDLMVDVLYGEGQVTRIESRYQKSKNTHGTGCSLACELLSSDGKLSTDLASGYCVQSCKWA